MQLLLKNRGVADIEDIGVYRERGGYEALRKAMAMRPAEIIDLVQQAGLRGRGGAAFPTAEKWKAVAEQSRTPHYFVCNAAEGEPGSFKDRELLKDPHQTLESTAIASYAVGAEKAFLYLRG